LKKNIPGCHFLSDEEVMMAVVGSVEKTQSFQVWADGTLSTVGLKVHHTRWQLHQKRRGGYQLEIS
jgi:hypothetical protein